MSFVRDRTCTTHLVVIPPDGHHLRQSRQLVKAVSVLVSIFGVPCGDTWGMLALPGVGVPTAIRQVLVASVLVVVVVVNASSVPYAWRGRDVSSWGDELLQGHVGEHGGQGQKDPTLAFGPLGQRQPVRLAAHQLSRRVVPSTAADVATTTTACTMSA